MRDEECKAVWFSALEAPGAKFTLRPFYSGSPDDERLTPATAFQLLQARAYGLRDDPSKPLRSI